MLILFGPSNCTSKNSSSLETAAQVHRDVAHLFVNTKNRNNPDPTNREHVKLINYGVSNCWNTMPLLKECNRSIQANMEKCPNIVSEMHK